MPDETPKPDESPATPKPVSGKTALFGCLILIVLAFGGCGALAVFGDHSADPQVDTKVYCEEYVKTALKSPATADFSREDATEHAADGTYVVTGAVDSQNSFGATVRNTFTCTVRKNGKTWDLVSLTGLSH